MKRVFTLTPWLVIPFLLSFAVVYALTAQKATLTTPTTVGQVKVVDVSDIVLAFSYDAASNQYKLDEIRIAAHEGEIINDGQANERFVRHGGKGFTVKAADLPASIITAIENVKDRAVRAYIAREGITATVQ